MLPVGGTVAVAGALLTATALGAGNRAVNEATAPGVSVEAFDSARRTYKNAGTQLLIGDILIGAGVVVSGIGGGMLLDGASISPWWIPGGAGIGMTIGGAK